MVANHFMLHNFEALSFSCTILSLHTLSLSSSSSSFKSHSLSHLISHALTRTQFRILSHIRSFFFPYKAALLSHFLFFPICATSFLLLVCWLQPLYRWYQCRCRRWRRRRQRRRRRRRSAFPQFSFRWNESGEKSPSWCSSLRTTTEISVRHFLSSLLRLMLCA